MLLKLTEEMLTNQTRLRHSRQRYGEYESVRSTVPENPKDQAVELVR